MGADLYIRSIYDANNAKYKPLFDEAVKKRDSLTGAQAERAQEEVAKYYDLMYSEGYFRDSYNSTSVMWTLGLSWWSDVIPLLHKGILSPKQAAKLKEMISNAAQTIPQTKEELSAKHLQVDDAENSVSVWHNYFVEKKQRLLDFLQQAIDLNEGIDCSL